MALCRAITLSQSVVIPDSITATWVGSEVRGRGGSPCRPTVAEFDGLDGASQLKGGGRSDRRMIAEDVRVVCNGRSKRRIKRPDEAWGCKGRQQFKKSATTKRTTMETGSNTHLFAKDLSAKCAFEAPNEQDDGGGDSQQNKYNWKGAMSKGCRTHPIARKSNDGWTLGRRDKLKTAEGRTGSLRKVTHSVTKYLTHGELQAVEMHPQDLNNWPKTLRTKGAR
ncbi:hypothetical protein C8F01DRAFT_1228782 [Mycena amicta]|nr:hypothetical protein C8F01DRAFT_1228782 [Mycena amicta]